MSGYEQKSLQFFTSITHAPILSRAETVSQSKADFKSGKRGPQKAPFNRFLTIIAKKIHLINGLVVTRFFNTLDFELLNSLSIGCGNTGFPDGHSLIFPKTVSRG